MKDLREYRRNKQSCYQIARSVRWVNNEAQGQSGRAWQARVDIVSAGNYGLARRLHETEWETAMNFVISTGGQIVGCTVFALLIVRGLVAIANDFTTWTLRRNGMDEK
jgi:hypothetical protein